MSERRYFEANRFQKRVIMAKVKALTCYLLALHATCHRKRCGMERGQGQDLKSLAVK